MARPVSINLIYDPELKFGKGDEEKKTSEPLVKEKEGEEENKTSPSEDKPSEEVKVEDGVK